VTRLARILAVVLAAGCGAASAAAPLALHTCRLTGLDHDAQCGVLKRPLDPAKPQGTQIDLHVVVISALARQKLPDPIFFFAGGPGQSAIGLAGTIEHLTSRLGARRDLVLIDQRGTGHSAPLQCDVPEPDEALARALDRSRAIAALDACRTKLQQLPWGDLRFYTTTIAMADADAVRVALGADKIDLIGISYGSRAALEYLRAYPQHVRRSVIDGVAPPDMVLPVSDDIDGQAALQALLRDCAAEKACAAVHPALAEPWPTWPIPSLASRCTCR
jgi:pimeloyl-ACP methyl ester carboxylesterase